MAWAKAGGAVDDRDRVADRGQGEFKTEGGNQRSSAVTRCYDDGPGGNAPSIALDVGNPLLVVADGPYRHA